MTLEEIKKAVDEGKTVFWSNTSYVVIPHKKTPDTYLIKFLGNGHMIGLTWADNVTLNGKEEDFFVEGSYPYGEIDQ